MVGKVIFKQVAVRADLNAFFIHVIIHLYTVTCGEPGMGPLILRLGIHKV